MGRRTGFVGLINQIAREQARAERRRIAAHNRSVRDQARALRERERQVKLQLQNQKQYEKEMRQLYLETRQQETADLNDELAAQIQELESILNHTLSVDDRLNFKSLLITENFTALQIPAELARPLAEPTKEYFQPQPLQNPVGFLEKLLYGANGKNNRKAVYEQSETQRAGQAYARARAHWQESEQKRRAALNNLKTQHQMQEQAFQRKKEERRAEVAKLEAAYGRGEAEAVVTYNEMVLERSIYPDNFPQEFKVAYVPASKELVINYQLPDISTIPTAAEYKFVKTKDEIQTKARKLADVKTLYADALAAVCLRTLHEVFEADTLDWLAVAVFNGWVQAVDPTTGRDVQPYLISVRAIKEKFMAFDLSRVDKKVCLRNLGARVSPQPDECLAVKPVVDFKMVDRRFVDGSNVLAELDARPNLMELNPFEFENLVGNLFTAMGLETRQTQSSRDGGVDVIAYDARPVLGGKVVVQAKRYKNTVGVAAVRDLYGTMINEGASKGILVATSGYGKDAFEFAKDKPIELIDGGGLLYLLEHHANVPAKIII